MISVSCSCGRRFKAEDHHAGKRTRCPVCGNMLVIGQSAVTGPFRDQRQWRGPVVVVSQQSRPQDDDRDPTDVAEWKRERKWERERERPRRAPHDGHPLPARHGSRRSGPGDGATTRGRTEASNADHGADRWGRGDRHPRPGGPRLVPAARRRQWRRPAPGRSPSSPGGQGGNRRDAGGDRGHRGTTEARRELGRGGRHRRRRARRDEAHGGTGGHARPGLDSPAPAPDTRLFLPFRRGHESLAASHGGLHEGPDRRDRQSQ